MAVIHRTTMTPGKLELLAAWLPAQPWYVGHGGGPALTRAGGFRLDDPAGEVGIEFLIAVDAWDDQVAAYLVPLTYRGTPEPAMADALIGTTEHGVLGRRWVYDGVHDPVLVAQLLAFLQGQVQAQAQRVSNTVDRSVVGRLSVPGSLVATASTVVAGLPGGTDVLVESVHENGAPAQPMILRVVRALLPDVTSGLSEAAAVGHVSAGWQWPDGTVVRDHVVLARTAA
jgi:hypothetical protein